MTSITLYKQIHPKQCPILANIGFKSLINLRCDDECPDQPTSYAIEQSAKACGLAYQHLPYDSENCSKAIVHDFAQAIHALPKPILVFCGTGGRAKRLYQSAKISGLVE